MKVFNYLVAALLLSVFAAGDGARELELVPQALNSGVATIQNSLKGLTSLIGETVPIIPATLSKVTSDIIPDVVLASQILALDKLVNGEIWAIGLPDLSVLRLVLETSLSLIAPSAGICKACQVVMGFFMLRTRILNGDANDVITAAEFICIHFKIATREVCQGIMKRQVPSIYFVITSKPELRADTFCGVFLQSFDCSTTTTGDSDWLEWNVELLPMLPQYSHARRTLGGVQQEEDRIIKIVHLSDIHMDPEYDPGSLAVCDNKILCCSWARETVRTPWHGAIKRSEEAGWWGDGRVCDVPVHTLEMTLKHITRQHPDMNLLYITGDLVPVDFWRTTIQSNTNIIHRVANLVRKYLPPNVPVIIAHGNHEPDQVNYFSPRNVPPSLDTTWVYTVMYNAFGTWIPDDQADQFKTRGSYAIQISPNLRVLVLNTNVCYQLNVWLLYQPNDPDGQLQWLIDELEFAEGGGQRVHIVGHVPPGDRSCFHIWSRNFYKIVRRFHRTIAGQFYGHTHQDHFKLMYRDGHPVNVAWIAPSLTPYGQDSSNLAYRVYHVTDDNYQVQDHETWTFDLSEANREWRSRVTGAPFESFWKVAYQFTTEYNLRDASIQSLHSLTGALARDGDLHELFLQHQFKHLVDDDGNYEEAPNCDHVCRKKSLCDIVSYFSPRRRKDGTEECQRLSRIIDEND